MTTKQSNGRSRIARRKSLTNRRKAKRRQVGSGYCSSLRGQYTYLHLASQLSPAQLAKLSGAARKLPKRLLDQLPKAFEALAVVNSLARLFCDKQEFKMSIKDARRLARDVAGRELTNFDARLADLHDNLEVVLNKDDIAREGLKALTQLAEATHKKLNANTSADYKKALIQEHRAFRRPAGRLLTGLASGLHDKQAEANILNSFDVKQLADQDHFRKLQRQTKDKYAKLPKLIQQALHYVLNKEFPETVVGEIPYMNKLPNALTREIEARTLPKIKQYLHTRIDNRIKPVSPDQIENVVDFVSSIPSKTRMNTMEQLLQHPLYTQVVPVIAQVRGWTQPETQAVAQLGPILSSTRI